MRHVDTLLLLALPASGKSELRRYLASLDERVMLADFGLGPTVDLDDYPYVHFMRRIDQTLDEAGARRVFYPSDHDTFRDGRDWATLIHLVNEDYAALGTGPAVPMEPTQWFLDRLAGARSAAGIEPALPDWTGSIPAVLTQRLQAEIAAFARERADTLTAYDPGRSTVIVEFARGGPDGAVPPLNPPHGYQFSLAALSDDLVDRSKALYVWVTPEESRRRNRERAKPGPDGDASILHHGVPERVMRNDYGTDDFLWLLERGGGEALAVERHPTSFRIPAAVFDNREDRTSFLRAEHSRWDAGAVADLHERLTQVFARLAG